ncbi:class GN sortase [Shewanella sp. 125m-7]
MFVTSSLNKNAAAIGVNSGLKHRGQYHRYFCCLLLIFGAGLVVHGGYMQAKAHFAQFLIQQAWQKTLQDRKPHKPWSWADTHPVAKLDFLSAIPVQGDTKGEADSEGDSLYVLAGASGRNLAFGPAHMLSTANINARGNTVIAGHRDTHFSRLSGTKVGQLFRLQSASGKHLIYRVKEIKVVHESDTSVIQEYDQSLLTLVTCYPFGAEISGGPLRFVVQAVPIN